MGTLKKTPWTSQTWFSDHLTRTGAGFPAIGSPAISFKMASVFLLVSFQPHPQTKTVPTTKAEPYWAIRTFGSRRYSLGLILVLQAPAKAKPLMGCLGGRVEQVLLSGCDLFPVCISVEGVWKGCLPPSVMPALGIPFVESRSIHQTTHRKGAATSFQFCGEMGGLSDQAI